MPRVIREVPTGKYPCLMESIVKDSLVVYFFEEGEGVILFDSDDDNDLFYRSDDWDMDDFKPFEGEVIFP